MVRSLEVALILLPQLREHLQRILRASLLSIDPSRVLINAHANGAFASIEQHRLHVIAAGKAAWPMAHVCAELMADRIDRALVAGSRVPRVRLPDNWQALESAHPFPDEASVEAGRAALSLAQETGNRRLLVLLSGGASAMICAPVPGVPLDDKVAITRALMNAGVPIHDLNCVRKHLSGVKGGRLAAAASASLTLAISDVHHPVPDDPSVIGSGPTAADPTTFAQALDIVRRVHGVPQSVLQHLRNGADGRAEETMKLGDSRLSNARFIVVANRETALRTAAETAAALGYAVTIVNEPTHGEARIAAKQFAARALHPTRAKAKPVCVLAAGETTVRLAGHGRGGRNQELVLALVPEVAGYVTTRGQHANVVAASIGTDGIDGPTPAAGAVVDSTTFARARAAGLDYRRSLEDNDAYPFFEALDDLVVLGPTGSNVGDLQVMLISSPA